MARTHKVGIDYFPFDVDFFNDEKIEFTSARFGVKGEVITIRLLCKIYRNGYYTVWNEDESTLLAKRAGDGISHSLVSDVVKELVRRGFFDESLLVRFGILTSKGIQNRYFEATKRYQYVEVNADYLLVNLDKFNNVNIIKINADINSKNDNTNTQIEKEIEKEIKEKNKREKTHPRFSPPTLEEVKNFFIKDKNVYIQNAGILAERFINFYESKNWFVGKNKMTNWKSAATRSLDWGGARKNNCPVSGNENQKSSYDIFKVNTE